uniref:Uncharacterized protein n=1 Tax=Anguilla anguilla TaxID=7936 RepID=A0A0E9Y0J4_ANGAN
MIFSFLGENKWGLLFFSVGCLVLFYFLYVYNFFSALYFRILWSRERECVVTSLYHPFTQSVILFCSEVIMRCSDRAALTSSPPMFFFRALRGGNEMIVILMRPRCCSTWRYCKRRY